MIKYPFTKSLSSDQIKRNRNKALSKLLVLSSANQLLVKEYENFWRISLNQIFMIVVKSNASKIEKLKSCLRDQKLKIIQKL